MSSVTPLFAYRNKQEDLGQTTLAFVNEFSTDTVKIQQVASASGRASAASLYDEADVDLSRFFQVSAEAIAALEECAALLAREENFAADDQLMHFKKATQELYLLRDISDAAGLISLKMLQASNSVKAVTLRPQIVGVCLSALRRLWNEPFMDFNDAIPIADQLEDVMKLPPVPGLLELIAPLLQSNGDSDQ